MRIARDFGTVEQLLPPGVTDIRDASWRLFEAIRMAMFFLSFEELEKKERPPKKIWLDPEQLAAWFERVEKDREREYGKNSKSGGEEMVQNDAARDLIAGE